MRLDRFAVAALAVWMTAGATATTIQVDGYDNAFGMGVTVNVNGADQQVWAGPIKLEVDGSKIAEAFCVDFFTGINYQTYVVNSSAPAPGFFDTAGRIYSEYISDMNNASGGTASLYGAAMQLALWEVTIDNLASSTTLEASALTTGNFKESTTSPWGSQLESLVIKYLDGAFTAPPATNTVIYTGPDQKIQELITGGNPGTPGIPEPSTFLTIGAALLGLGLMRRRS